MTKIAFVCDWGKSPKQLLEMYKKQTPLNTGKWKSLVGVDSPRDADFVIVLGRWSQAYKKYTSKGILQFRREPDFIRPFFPSPHAEHIYDYTGTTFHAATWKLNNSFSDLIIKNYPHKIKKLSCIVTDKYRNRIDVIRNFETIYPHNMDVFGRFTNPGSRAGINYKGQLFDKSKAFDPYKYTLVMENSQQRNYWTEKIVDAFLSWSIPIYWGCPNILEFFPEDSFYAFDMSNPEDIKEIIKKPIEKKHIAALKEARNLVLFKYNIWPAIEKEIN